MARPLPNRPTMPRRAGARARQEFARGRHVRLGADIQNKSYLDQLEAISAWFGDNFGTLQGPSGESFGRVPGNMAEGLIDYWTNQMSVANLSRGPAAITSAPPGDWEAVEDAFRILQDIWQPLYDDDGTQSGPDTLVLWDTLLLAAGWADQHSEVSPQKITLTAPTSTPGVPPPFGKRPPPKGGKRKPGAMGWLMLVVALYIATRSR